VPGGRRSRGFGRAPVVFFDGLVSRAARDAAGRIRPSSSPGDGRPDLPSSKVHGLEASPEQLFATSILASSAPRLRPPEACERDVI
jgi:hypothetical protein